MEAVGKESAPSSHPPPVRKQTWFMTASENLCSCTVAIQGKEIAGYGTDRLGPKLPRLILTKRFISLTWLLTRREGKLSWLRDMSLPAPIWRPGVLMAPEWTQKFPATAVPRQNGISLIYDEALQLIVMVLRVNASETQTWTWNGTDWTQVSTRGPGPGPKRR